VYEGLDQQIRTMVESMCQDGFLSKSPTAAWEFLEDLAEKIMQWETTRDDSLSSRIASAKGGLHAVSDWSHIESRFTALEKPVKGVNYSTISGLSKCYHYMFSLSIPRPYVECSSLLCSPVINWN